MIRPHRNDTRRRWRSSIEARFEKTASGNAPTDFEDFDVLFDISKGGDVSRSPLHDCAGLTESDPKSSKCFPIQDERFLSSRCKKNEY